MSKARSSFTAEQKADVDRRHLKDKVTMGELSEEIGIQPFNLPKFVNGWQLRWRRSSGPSKVNRALKERVLSPLLPYIFCLIKDVIMRYGAVGEIG